MSDTTASSTHPSSGGGHPSAPQKRRWHWILLAVIVVVALLIVAAEFAARAIVPGIVRSAVVSSLELPEDQQMDVETSGFLLPQLLKGRFDTLRLSSDEVEFEGLTGAVDVDANGVPFRGGEISHAHGTITLTSEQFAAILDRTALPVDGVALDDPNITVSATASLFGNELPLDVTMTPGAEDGEVLLAPVSLAAGDMTVSVEDLRALLGGLGDVGDLVTSTQRICIADRLPAGLTLTRLDVGDNRLVAEIAIDGRIGVDASLQQNGTC